MSKPDLPRSIGVWGGAAIMVGVMIGSGIFRTPTEIAAHMGSPPLILLLWVAGGGLCLLGALTFAELATMFPRSGGLYVFLREGFGPLVAFVFGWTYFLITQPMAVAGIITVFSEHLKALCHLNIDHRIITCAAILALTMLNATGMKRGAGVAIALTGFKALALAGIVLLALLLPKGDAGNFAASQPPGPWAAGLVTVLAAILWTYDGWSDVSAVAEEVREPQRQIPRVFLLGTIGTALLYVAVNAVYIWLVPLPEMRATQTVAPLAMERLIGAGGHTVVTVLVLISVLGAGHASIIVGSRVIFAQARDELLFRVLGRVHAVYATPHVALWGQAVLACLAALTLKHFSRLMGGFVFTIWIFYGLAAAAILILRVRRPDAVRPYRCWGYPVVPAVFILVAAVMTGLSIRQSPQETLPWVGVLFAGAPVYYLWRRWTRPAL